MSDTPETETGDEMTMSLKFHNGDTMTMQQVVHGMRPQVLIQMSLTGDDETMHFDIDATGPAGQNDLAELLEFIAAGMREGEVTSRTVGGLTATRITEDDLNDEDSADD